jgi:hypothetical protein
VLVPPPAQLPYRPLVRGGVLPVAITLPIAAVLGTVITGGKVTVEVMPVPTSVQTANACVEKAALTVASRVRIFFMDRT